MTSPPPAPHCPTCGYNLTGLPENRCPECGSTFDLSRLCTIDRKRSYLKALLIVSLHLGAFAIFTAAVALMVEVTDPPRFGWWEGMVYGLLLFVAATNSWKIADRLDRLIFRTGPLSDSAIDWKRMVAMVLVLLMLHYFALILGVMICLVISIEAGWTTMF